MRQLILKQKLAFLDSSILEMTEDPWVEYLLCWQFDSWMIEKHNIRMNYDDEVEYYFPELWKEIQKAIKRTGGINAIWYKRHTTSRVMLLKRVKNQIESKQ